MRIFLIGLSEGFARSMARYVSGDRRVELSGVAPSLALAGIMLPLIRPALVLVDWAALVASHRDSLQALRHCCPGLRIVCLASEAAAYSDAATQAGADAVIAHDQFAVWLDFLLRGSFAGHGVAREDHHV